LPTASSRFRIAPDTLAVRLTLPHAGCVEDLHLQVSAPCRAHTKKGAGLAAPKKYQRRRMKTRSGIAPCLHRNMLQERCQRTVSRKSTGYGSGLTGGCRASPHLRGDLDATGSLAPHGRFESVTFVAVLPTLRTAHRSRLLSEFVRPPVCEETRQQPREPVGDPGHRARPDSLALPVLRREPPGAA